jgi:hypothetical protein
VCDVSLSGVYLSSSRRAVMDTREAEEFIYVDLASRLDRTHISQEHDKIEDTWLPEFAQSILTLN